MGNYRFRLSDMIPSAWFYKLRDMSRTRKHNPSHSVKKKLPVPNTTSQKTNHSRPRHSYYDTTESTRADKFCSSSTNPKATDTHFPDPPGKSSKRRTKRKTIYKPSPSLVTSSVSADCSCHAALNSAWIKTEKAQAQDYLSSSTDNSPEPDFFESRLSEFDNNKYNINAPQPFSGLASWSNACSCRFSSSATDILIEMNEESYSRKIEKLEGFNAISELELPPILTMPAKRNDVCEEAAKFRTSSELEEIKAHDRSLSIKTIKEDRITTRGVTKTSPAVIRKSVPNLTRVKLRANSPRLASKKIQAHGRKSVSTGTGSKSRRKSFSESFAIVKSSSDPQKEFKDSMMEMIVENNIRASNDLEELLACYLQLNSDEYHNLIVEAFEQIWFGMPDLRI